MNAITKHDPECKRIMDSFNLSKNRLRGLVNQCENCTLQNIEDGKPLGIEQWSGREKALFQEANAAQIESVRLNLLAGQAMVEQMGSMVVRKNGLGPVQAKSARQIFAKWLGNNCPGIPRSRAYLWMAAASHVMRLLLEIRGPKQTEIPVWITAGGNSLFISEVLGMPEIDCAPTLLTFRATFDIFLCDSDSVGDAADWLDGLNSRRAYARSHPKANAPQPGDPPGGLITFLQTDLTSAMIALHSP